MALLAAMVQKEDDCWELKLSCMMSLFLKACEDAKSPTVMESVRHFEVLEDPAKPDENDGTVYGSSAHYRKQ